MRQSLVLLFVLLFASPAFGFEKGDICTVRNPSIVWNGSGQMFKLEHEVVTVVFYVSKTDENKIMVFDPTDDKTTFWTMQHSCIEFGGY